MLPRNAESKDISKPKNKSCKLKSRSEEAPGSVFHPRDKNGKIDCNFLGPFWYNIKVDPEI